MSRCVFLFSFFFFALAINAQNDGGVSPLNYELLSVVDTDNILSNDVWGYVSEDGIEYAILGTRSDCRIYNIQDPTIPELVATIPGASSVWRDFKVYDKYIYQTTDQGREGLRIIDMSRAPDTITSVLWNPNLTVGGRTEPLETCHNLWIDEEIGHAYLAGCNNGVGGVIILDLKKDPLSPTLIGALDDAYAHDVITSGDTVYTSEIFQGNLGIYDISDVDNPVIISRTQTSSRFTHNAWYTDDRNFILTTDERGNSFVDAYDISDHSRPSRVDTYQPLAGAGVVPHNVHVLDDFVVTSWYTEGIIVLDAHRPHNLVKVAQYDTFDGPNGGTNGCWGAYPYFPSGVTLASDISNGLFLLKPQYQRAAYLEGQILELGTNLPINNATIVINDSDQTEEVSDATGSYATGTAAGLRYQVFVSHPDYFPDTLQVFFENGEVIFQDVFLRPRSEVLITGKVTDSDGIPISNAIVALVREESTTNEKSNSEGTFTLSAFSQTYTVYAGKWGYIPTVIEDYIPSGELNIVLEEGYQDNFNVDLGWTIESTADAGLWERAIPNGTQFGNDFSNPNMDTPEDQGEYAYVTGNSTGSVGADDVDDGYTRLISPAIPMEEFGRPVISFRSWFYNAGGNSEPNDTLRVFLRLDTTRIEIDKIFYEDGSGRWSEPNEIVLAGFLQDVAGEFYNIEFEARDDPGSGHLVEAGIDQFSIFNSTTTSIPEIDKDESISIYPNPTSQMFSVFSKTSIQSVEIHNSEGRLMRRVNSDFKNILVTDLSSGIYVVKVEIEEGVKNVRLIKL